MFASDVSADLLSVESADGEADTADVLWEVLLFCSVADVPACGAEDFDTAFFVFFLTVAFLTAFTVILQVYFFFPTLAVILAVPAFTPLQCLLQKQ